MPTITSKIPFLCLVSCCLCAPLFGANFQVHDCKEEKVYQSTVHHSSPGQLQVVSNEHDIFDYTESMGENVDHSLDEEEKNPQYMQYSLEGDIPMIEKRLQEKNTLLLGTVLENTENGKLYRYLFCSKDLVQEQEQEAIRRAHRGSYGRGCCHLIQSKSPHVILQLLGWLHRTQKYTVKALHTNLPVCQNCHLFAWYLFGIELDTSEKGCLGNPFPASNQISPLSLAYINDNFNAARERIDMLCWGYYRNAISLPPIREIGSLVFSFYYEYETHIPKHIAAKYIPKKLDQLRKCCAPQVPDINIHSFQSVSTFLQHAQAKYRELGDIAKELLALHDKYKGDDWKMFHEKSPNGQSWLEVYKFTKEKMDFFKKIFRVFYIFFVVTQNLNLILSKKEAQDWGVKEKCDQFSVEKFESGVVLAHLKGRLQLQDNYLGYPFGWRWQT